MATVARFCARPALRAAAEEMETEAATEADILALVGVVEREGRPARNPRWREKILDECGPICSTARVTG